LREPYSEVGEREEKEKRGGGRGEGERWGGGRGGERESTTGADGVSKG